MHDQIDDQLLERYCAGDCTPAEKAEVERWIASDPARGAYVELVKAAWLEAGAAGLPPSHARPDVGAAWRQVEKRIRWVDRPPLRIAPGDAVAASRRRFAPRWRPLAVAAGVGVLALMTQRVVQFLTPPARPTPMSEVTTLPGQRATVRLPDSTRVVLGPASRLRYPAAWLRGPRRVELEGAAYFVVTHDSTRPFTVRTARGIAADLGTRFAVRAYRTDAAVSVAVAEGSVAITAAPDSLGPRSRRPALDGLPERLVLTGGDLGRIAADGRLAVERAVNVDRYVAWADGRLVFQDTPLGDAVVELSRWYDLDIRLADGTLGRRPLTAAFKDEPALETLRLIAATLNLKLTRNGREVVLSR
jgi:transmembrane sensor